MKRKTRIGLIAAIALTAVPLTTLPFIAISLVACEPSIPAGALAHRPGGSLPASGARIIGHDAARLSVLSQIPESAIAKAKSDLHIAYGHTSHGSQIISGMSGLRNWVKAPGGGERYAFSISPAIGSLHLYEGDYYGSGDLDHDAGYYPAWVNETEAFLNDPKNKDYNVIMWSWCGQVAGKTEQSMINEYLKPMSDLEAKYPTIKFIYMTGHLDGSGEKGNLHLRNEQIRKYCRENSKWLYDFADIESYDPDGNCYLSKMANDECDYDSDSDGSRDANWATAWQAKHTGEWFECGSAHSQPLNANMKAYAAWYLFARLAGWNG